MRRNIFRNKQAIGLLFSLWFSVGASSVAQHSMGKAESKPYSLEITPKLHTAGHSLYSGVYLNHHVNLEINASFKYKQMGAFVTKYVDIADTHSSINFASVGIYRSLDINRSVKVTPYLGYFLKQVNSFMDNGSNMWAGLVVRIDISERLWIENTALVANLLHKIGNTKSLANRFNVAMMIGKFRLDTYTWYTHDLHRELHYVGACLAVASPEWVLTPSVSAKVQLSMLQKLSENKPEGAFDRGVVMTLIIPIDCNPK